MASRDKNVITCVEFGTHSVRVLHGTRDSNGDPVILGVGQALSGEAICKGEVIDNRQAASALKKALSDADKAAGNIRERRSVYCIVNGASVVSRQSEGTIVTGEDRKIRAGYIENAVQRALNIDLGPDQVFLGSFDSCFMLDNHTLVQNPEGESATRLTACLHIISARKQMLETLRNLLRESSFEEKIHFVYSPVASAYGILHEKEKHDGVLLIDLGCGVTSYAAIRRDGILSSGSLSVGTDNIANDLSIGLDLPIDYCRKMLLDQELFKRINKGEAFLETHGPVSGTVRKIPLGSIETIIQCRLQEIFSILREKLDHRTCAPQMESGIVLCGGGSLIPPVRQLLSSNMRMTVRMGQPVGFGILPNEIEQTMCFTSILGIFRYALETSYQTENSARKMGDVLEGFGERMIRKLKDFTGALKI